MSFKLISNTHGRPDSDLGDNAERAFRLTLLKKLLNGTFYDRLRYDFSEAFDGNSYIYLQDRRPNVPTGTNEIKIQAERHAAMLFGEETFPDIETANAEARTVIQKLVQETQLTSVMMEATKLGSIGSVAIHMRALDQGDAIISQPGKVKIFFDVYTTEYLEATFDPQDPTMVKAVRERYKIKGAEVKAMGYPVEKKNLLSDYFFHREWDTTTETWFVPYLVDAYLNDPVNNLPKIDEDLTTEHNLGRCPWEWVKLFGAGREADGECTWQASIDHAIQLDYEDSQIVAGIRYAMNPTTVISTPKGAAVAAPKADDGSMVKGPETTLTVDEKAKVYMVQMNGESFKEAREKAKELRTSVLRATHGSVIDPKEITQGHQGSKTMAMIDAAILGHVARLRSPFGVALLNLVKMALMVAKTRDVIVGGKPIDKSMANIADLTLRWGAIYPLTAAENQAEAMADDVRIKNGTLSRQTSIKKNAPQYRIDDVASEEAQIAKELAELPPPGKVTGEGNSGAPGN